MTYIRDLTVLFFKSSVLHSIRYDRVLLPFYLRGQRTPKFGRMCNLYLCRVSLRSLKIFSWCLGKFTLPFSGSQAPHKKYELKESWNMINKALSKIEQSPGTNCWSRQLLLNMTHACDMLSVFLPDFYFLFYFFFEDMKMDLSRYHCC